MDKNRYGQYCPIAKSLQVLGGRWTLLIVRELLLADSRRFSDLTKGLPRLSRSVLAERLRQLGAAGIVERSEGEGEVRYRLTRAGQELRPVLEALLAWGAKWAFEEPEEDDLDPVLLMWWVRNGVRTERLPEGRTVVQFEFRAVEQRFWLVLERDDASLCLKRPRFDVDVFVDADLAAFYEVWLGRRDYWEAVACGRIAVEATPELERAFPSWLTCSPAAEAVQQGMRERGRLAGADGMG